MYNKNTENPRDEEREMETYSSLKMISDIK